MFQLSGYFKSGSLRLRLIVFVCLPLIASISLLAFLVLSYLEREGEKKMQEDVELIARVLQAPLSHALQKNREGALEQTLQATFKLGRVYGVYLYDQRGQVLSRAGNATVDSALKSSISLAVSSGQRMGEYAQMDGRAVYSYFVPLKNADEQLIGLLQVTRRHRDFREHMSRLRVGAAVFMLLATTLMTGIIFAGYDHAIGQSLRQLRQSMARVESGEHHHRAAGAGPKEIGALAHSLNAMLDAMAQARREIRERQKTAQLLEKKLQCSKKMAMIGHLAAGMAHELGAPLSLIDGKAQRLLRRRHTAALDGAPLIRDIREQVKRMDSLIRQLLDFGRPSNPQRKRIGADELAEMALRAIAEWRGNFSSAVLLEGPQPGADLCVHPFRVEMALKNLLQNSIQAAPDGKVRLAWTESERDVVFTVSDDGPGIPPENENLIFDPFFTTKRNNQGTGLGLTVVQQVIQEHQARIEVGCSNWGGAEFRLVFPKTLPPRHDEHDG